MLTKKTALVLSLLMVMAIAVTAAAPGGQKGKTVPRAISGEMDGRFAFAGETAGEVEGTLSHLGLAQMYTTHTPNMDTGELSGGEFTIVAANGDEIRGTYTGSGIVAPDWSYVLGTANFIVTGGTGRFARASGSISASFVETFDDPSWASAGVTWNLDGIVHY